MQANARSLRFLGEGKKLSVPFFQRRYVWGKSNWDELLETFQNSEIMPFLGSIILKEESSKESIIVDGQQRLTTITILAKAIYDSLTSGSKQPGSGIKNGIENFLYYRNNAADDFSDSHVKIAHSRIDQKDYNLVIESQMLHNVPAIDLDTINETSGNVLQCYKHYREKLLTYSDNQLKGLFNSIFDENRKVFVLIELEHGDINEQTIFDTINRAGIRLSTADIIKNNLFKKLLEAAGDDEAQKNYVYDIYNTCWEDIFNPSQQVSELWDEERVFGNVKHNNLEFLLYCVACIKWGETGDMFSKLENVFERETSQMGFAELKRLAEEIKEYALIFKKYILDFKETLEDEDKSTYFKYSDSVSRLLLILQKFQVQMFYPYVIMRLKDVNQDENDEALKRDFRILESFVVRRKISPKGTHDYTSKCYEIIKDGITSLVKSDLGNDTAGLTDYDIKQYLKNTRDDSARMILFWIELYRRRLPGYDFDAMEYKYTLEHIMPKRWETNWANVSIVDNGVTLSVNSEEGKAFRNSAIQELGNKTLLTHSLNAAVKNAEYEKKIKGVSTNKVGYQSHTSLLVTKELVDEAPQEHYVWDEQHIFERTKQLCNEFIEIWPSFKELMPQDPQTTSSDDSTLVNQFTAEQLADPVKLLEAMDTASSIDETDGMLSVAEFIQRVNVQSETVEKYIRDGKLVPDLITPVSEHRSNKYFKEEKLEQIAAQFGWTLITDENRKTVFMDMIEQMDMSYSYKPVLIKAILSNADSDGKCRFSDVVMYFLNYYKTRIQGGLIAEKSDSVFAKEDCTYEQAERVITIYPLKRFSDIGAMRISDSGSSIEIDNSIWTKLNEAEKTHIISTCDLKLSTYFSRI